MSATTPDPARIAELTDSRRACLRLVYRHMSSKDIARGLGISPHTVDARSALTVPVARSIAPWPISAESTAAPAA